jgi:hypothetical protein
MGNLVERVTKINSTTIPIRQVLLAKIGDISKLKTHSIFTLASMPWSQVTGCSKYKPMAWERRKSNNLTP